MARPHSRVKTVKKDTATVKKGKKVGTKKVGRR